MVLLNFVYNKKSIKELADILDELELTELSYQKGDISISVSKGTTLSAASTKATSIEDSKVVSNKDYRDDPRVIKSPMVGTVYLQPEPGANKFINEGDSISSGQTMLIIEAMKTMNPIESNLQGKISKIFVQNEEAVEFGQPLVLVE